MFTLCTIILSLITSFLAGVVSSYITFALINKADDRKWKHVKGELLSNQRILYDQILTSIRIFLTIDIPTGFLKDEKKVFDFLKIEMIDNIDNYKSKIQFPDRIRSESFIRNMSGIIMELINQKDRFLLFKHSEPIYYQSCTEIIKNINNSLMPLRTFPELLDRSQDGNVQFAVWRDLLFNGMKLLMEIVYEAREKVKDI